MLTTTELVLICFRHYGGKLPKLVHVLPHVVLCFGNDPQCQKEIETAWEHLHADGKMIVTISDSNQRHFM
jgi:predicted transposase YbfD/YdcC